MTSRRGKRSSGTTSSNRALAPPKRIPPFLGEDYNHHWGIFVFQSKVILDVGADYGSTASYFLEKGAKMVIAVEADPALFEKLRSNFRGNSKVVPIFLEVTRPEHLADLITRFKPDVLKMDCEGCEAHLRKVRTSILRKVPEYLIETHEHIGRGTKPGIEHAFNRIKYLHETYEVLPGVEVVHAEKSWQSIPLAEHDFARLKNSLFRGAERLGLQSAELKKMKAQLDSFEKNLRSNPLSVLLQLYAKRPDLRNAYPEVQQGDHKRLLQWAKEVIKDHGDAYTILSPFESWYRNNSIVSEDYLTDFQRQISHEKTHADSLQKEKEAQHQQISELRQEVADFQRQISHEKTHADSLQKEKEAQHQQISELRQEVADLRITGLGISTKLLYAESELESIKSSFGFAVMRFYGTRIDRAFPDGTKRGEFKKLVRECLRIASMHGMRTLFRFALEKLSRHELTINPALPSVAKQIPIKRTKQLEPQLPEARAMLYCETPALSPREATNVPDAFIVSGWALAASPITEIRLYIDDEYVGSAHYGIPRPDIKVSYPSLPNCDKSGFQKLVFVNREKAIGRHLLRIEATMVDGTSTSIEGLLEIGHDLYENYYAPPAPRVDEGALQTKIRVIVHVGGHSLDLTQVLERIKHQRGIASPEILVLNSGKNDLGDLEQKFMIQVSDISPQTLPEMIRKDRFRPDSEPDYVLYILGDAIPASDRLLYDMIKIMEDNPAIAAAVPRQIPRSDADLMSCYLNWLRNHGTEEASTDQTQEIRSYEQLSQTNTTACACICFRKIDIGDFTFHEIGDSEPLILAQTDGLTVARVNSVGVIHSHNWSPSHYLKRNYAFHRFLGNPRMTNTQEAMSLEEAFGPSYGLYKSLNSAIDRLHASGPSQLEVAEAFRIVRDAMQEQHMSDVPRSQCEDLERVLSQVATRLGYERMNYDFVKQGELTSRFQKFLNTFQEWFTSSHDSLEGIEAELVETLYKICAYEIGKALGEAVLDVKIGAIPRETAILDAALGSWSL